MANDEPFTVNDRSTELELLYIDYLLKVKYIESCMGDTIARVKQDLNKGCYVLF